MGRKKLIRLEANIGRSNLFQDTHPDYLNMKGNWRKKYFSNENPIVVELGCGKGEYSLAMAAANPTKNFIGIDVKGDRLSVACEKADNLMLNNLAFIRANILELRKFFDVAEINEIWLTFPDPHIRKRDYKRRLTFTRFLKIYKEIIIQNGLLHLKTDSTELFEFSLDSLKELGVSNLQYTTDLYTSELLEIAGTIKTRFEEIFTEKGFKINFLYCNL
jgi:tRNA (guanine-N7-)-methyltransferase